MEIFFIILMGLIFGSFLNAWALRTIKNESINKGRSKCPQCNHQLSWRDLVPVLSWLILKGCCRYCHQKISWQYPVVEVVTALLFLGLYVKFGLSLNFFVASLVSSFLILIFLTDTRAYVIPDIFVILGIIAALGVQFFLATSLTAVLMGALIGGGFFLLQYLFFGEEWVGIGDSGVGALVGVLVGYPLIFTVLVGAYLSAGFVMVFALFFGKKQWFSKVPLGSFLVATAWVVWYCNLFY